MIELSKEWKLRSDKYQWVLERHTEGIKIPDITNHRTLEQAANYLYNQEAKVAESLQDIADHIEGCAFSLSEKLTTMGVSR